MQISLITNIIKLINITHIYYICNIIDLLIVIMYSNYIYLT